MIHSWGQRRVTSELNSSTYRRWQRKEGGCKSQQRRLDLPRPQAQVTQLRARRTLGMVRPPWCQCRLHLLSSLSSHSSPPPPPTPQRVRHPNNSPRVRCWWPRWGLEVRRLASIPPYPRFINSNLVVCACPELRLWSSQA